MSKLQSVDVMVFDQRLNLFSHDPNETIRAANELDSQIKALAKQYPDTCHKTVMLYTALKHYINIKKLEVENAKLKAELDELSKALQGFYV